MKVLLLLALLALAGCTQNTESNPGDEAKPVPAMSFTADQATYKLTVMNAQAGYDWSEFKVLLDGEETSCFGSGAVSQGDACQASPGTSVVVIYRPTDSLLYQYQFSDTMLTFQTEYEPNRVIVMDAPKADWADFEALGCAAGQGFMEGPVQPGDEYTGCVSGETLTIEYTPTFLEVYRHTF